VSLRDSWGPAWWLRSCTSVEPGARLRGRPQVMNAGRLTIGSGFRFCSTPVASHLITEREGTLEIGDRVSISYGAAIYCQSRIRIRDGARFGPFLVVSDTDFHVAGDRSASPEPKPVEVGREVRIGARVTILPGSTIGDGATVVAGSTVAGAVPAARSSRSAGSGAASGGRCSGRGVEEEALRSLVMRTLGLTQLPGLAEGPPQIPEWDSLGALRLLLAIESEFGVRVSEKEMVRARRIADLAAIVGGRAPESPYSAEQTESNGAPANRVRSPVGALVQRTLDLPTSPCRRAGRTRFHSGTRSARSVSCWP